MTKVTNVTARHALRKGLLAPDVRTHNPTVTAASLVTRPGTNPALMENPTCMQRNVSPQIRHVLLRGRVTDVFMVNAICSTLHSICVR